MAMKTGVKADTWKAEIYAALPFYDVVVVVTIVAVPVVAVVPVKWINLTN